jgi:hypothetical protein
MLPTKTMVIDPITHSNARTEIRLDQNRVYKGGLRLGNLGCQITTFDRDFAMYNTASGVLSLIRNIYLFDGNQLLDQLLDAHHMFAFRSFQSKDGTSNKNAFNYNINQQLIGLTNCYNVQHDPTEISLRPQFIEMMEVSKLAAKDITQTLRGWLNLNMHFNFLRNMVYTVNGQQDNYIDTSVFKSLKIIIEWRPQAELVSCFQGVTTGIAINILPPELYCDEVYGLSLPQSLQYQFDVYEVDKIVLNPVTMGASALTKARVNGFNGKFVKKLLLMNIDPASLRDDDEANQSIKCDGSEVYRNELLQLYVNGETLWDYMGIDSDARRVSMLADSWGSMNIPLGSYIYLEQDISSVARQAVQDLETYIGFYGCTILKRVTELVVEHARTASDAANLPFIFMYVWGEVAKQIVINNGSYNIMYA